MDPPPYHHLMSDAPLVTPAREVGPGGTIRFSVGSPAGRRSASWRIWSARNSPDVYLAGRSIAGVQKVSLHQSGSWSHSFVSDEKAEPFVGSGASRHVDIWQATPEFGPGWRRGYCIVVPDTGLRHWSEVEPGNIQFAPSPGAGHWVKIEIVFAAPGTTTRLVVEDTYAIGSMTLTGGSEVKIMARRVRPTQAEASQLAIARENVLQQIRAMSDREWLKNDAANPRLAIYGKQSDGTRFWADLALTPSPPGQATICTGRPLRVPASTEDHH
jgi:hypothetical protein